MKIKIVEKAYEGAVEVLEKSSRKIGFYASGLPGGYEALWARDSMITALGASLVGKKFRVPFRRSLETLTKNQSELGQIPNAVGTYNVDRRSSVTYNTFDSSLWYIIGHYVYADRYKDRSLLRRYKKSIDRAYLWLRYQDIDEVGLIAQLPTTDWQDAFPHKYGYVLSTMALYYKVLNLLGKKKEAAKLKRTVNGSIRKYMALYDKKLGYYRPWIWKNHNGIRESEDWFDTFGNVLAVLTGLATSAIAKKILRHIEKNKIARPYPCKALYPPIKKGSKEWHDYFEKAEAKTPYHYLNGGIWPFIGGFYVAALVKAGQKGKAKRELKKLAEANKKTSDEKLDWGFQEWLHGRTGKPAGGSNPYQAWSAGAYILAYEAVKNRAAF